MNIYADGGRIVMRMSTEEAEEWLPDFESGVYYDPAIANGLRCAIEKAKHNVAVEALVAATLNRICPEEE